MAGPKGTYGQNLQKVGKLLKVLNKKDDDGLSQLAAVSQSPNLPNGTALAPRRATSGNFLRATVFKSNGIWRKKSDVGFIKVTVVAGGGGAGGAKGGANLSPSGGTGGGGGAAISVLLGREIPSSVPVTVGNGGNGGAGATAANGSDGTSSSFGSLCSASHGTGGSGSDGSVAGMPITTVGKGGFGVLGDILLKGGAGEPGIDNFGIAGRCGPGGNGASQYGGGGADPNFTPLASSTNGINAVANTGGGGGGGCCQYNNGAATADGGNGAAGIIVIEEYSK